MNINKYENVFAIDRATMRPKEKKINIYNRWKSEYARNAKSWRKPNMNLMQMFIVCESQRNGIDNRRSNCIK